MWKDLEEKRLCKYPPPSQISSRGQRVSSKLCSSKTAEENEENIIKLNASPNRQNIKEFASNLVIEFHAGGARFEITTNCKYCYL